MCWALGLGLRVGLSPLWNEPELWGDGDSCREALELGLLRKEGKGWRFPLPVPRRADRLSRALKPLSLFPMDSDSINRTLSVRAGVSAVAPLSPFIPLLIPGVSKTPEPHPGSQLGRTVLMSGSPPSIGMIVIQGKRHQIEL